MDKDQLLNIIQVHRYRRLMWYCQLIRIGSDGEDGAISANMLVDIATVVHFCSCSFSIIADSVVHSGMQRDSNSFRQREISECHTLAPPVSRSQSAIQYDDKQWIYDPSRGIGFATFVGCDADPWMISTCDTRM